MYYDKIRHRHSQVLAATGLTPAEFDALLITFKYHWDEYYSHFTLDRSHHVLSCTFIIGCMVTDQ